MKRCKKCLCSTKFEVCETCNSVKLKLKKYHNLTDDPLYLIENLSSLKVKLKPDEKVLVGVSGGVDSSFIAVACGLAQVPVQLIHFDNGWNTQLAIQNINNIIAKFDFQLHTVVQHWPTFKSLQRSFLFSGVPDIELLTDHAIFSTLVECLRSNKNIRFVLSGSNFTTEHGIANDYVWNKWDVRNIRDINKKYENISLANYPTVGLYKWIYYRKVAPRQKVLVPLNNFYYKRSVALRFLSEQVNFTDYEYKHEESLLTKVYQRTILPRRYNYYKIEEHLSALIRNQEISYEEGVRKLKEFKSSRIDGYEMNYFRSKLSLSETDWENILNIKCSRHDDFANNKKIFKTLSKIGNFFNMRSID